MLLFSSGNAEERARQINELLTNKQLWKKLSTEALQHSKQYYWEKIVQRVEEVYKNV